MNRVEQYVNFIAISQRDGKGNRKSPKKEQKNATKIEKATKE